ncbi:MAG: DM13 domain-containing protein [Pontibacterium sp.]
MKLKTVFLLVITHGAVALAGFFGGIYTLPILIAPSAPSTDVVANVSSNAQYFGDFSRALEDSDSLHWGEGQLFVSQDAIAMSGELAPGPDYKLYLSPEFVETEADFNRLKSTMVQVGDVKTFNNFVVSVPSSVDINAFNTVIIWCESFGQFITAATYK